MFYDTEELNDGYIKLKLMKNYEYDKKTDWSAAYVFDILNLESNDKIGECDLRINHLDSTYIAGNIGYSIFESYQNKGYATKAVNLLINLARKHDMKYILITCDPSNLKSQKVIMKNNFKFIELTKIPPYHQMYKEGLREVLIYRLDL